MGFSTRSYAGPYVMGGGLPRGVKLLLIANVAMFLITWLLSRSSLLVTLLELLALTPSMVVTKFYVWQLATSMFMHSGIWHILMNMLGLWFFGGDLERSWGTDRFLKFYFFCGIGASVMVVIFHYLTSTQNVMTLGASGAVYGVILVAAILWPDRTIILYIFPIKLKYFAMILGVVSLWGLTQGGGGVSDIAHLSGMAFGYAYLKLHRRPNVRGRTSSTDFFGWVGDRYRHWKMQRAKKKFQVYLRKHGSDRDPWVH